MDRRRPRRRRRVPGRLGAAVYTWSPETPPAPKEELATVEEAVVGDDVVASAGSPAEPLGDWMIAELLRQQPWMIP